MVCESITIEAVTTGCPEGTTRTVKCPKTETMITQKCTGGTWITLPPDIGKCGEDNSTIIIIILSYFIIGINSKPKDIPQEHSPTNDIEEWDYKIYDKYLDVNCLNYCKDGYNNSYCKNAPINCYKLVRKLYSDSYCDISIIFVNEELNGTKISYRIEFDASMAVIPALYPNFEGGININYTANYTCYGRFVGYSE